MCAITVPNAEAHAPNELDLRFDNAALELLLQREEMGIKADSPAATLFLLCPGTPLSGEIGSKFGSDQSSLLVFGKHDRHLGIDGRLVLILRLR